MIDVLIGDCREVLKTLPDNSIHCCVTSPPYYGLRDYGTAKWEGGNPKCEHTISNHDADHKATFTDRVTRGERDLCIKCGALRVDKQIGLEKTPEEYVSSLVTVFREVKRVLRPDGTMWLNLGDSYWGGKGRSAHGNAERHVKRLEDGKTINHPYQEIGKPGWIAPKDGKHDTIKPKDLIGIPWRVAFALQEDGWYLRQDIIWSKNNPMPESVRDRCTKSHEYIFLFSKSPKYYYDNEAIKEPVAESTIGRGKVCFGGAKGRAYHPEKGDPNYRGGSEQWGREFDYTESCKNGRNKRTVWALPTKPYKGAHFATFPLELIEPCIKAGTSEHGVCSECGSPYIRVIEKHDTLNRTTKNGDGNGELGSYGRFGDSNVVTIDWKPSCTCNAPSISATVLDPFGGSGTVGQWCNQNNRNAVLIELNPEYKSLIEERINSTPKHKPQKRKVSHVDKLILQQNLTQYFT